MIKAAQNAFFIAAIFASVAHAEDVTVGNCEFVRHMQKQNADVYLCAITLIRQAGNPVQIIEQKPIKNPPQKPPVKPPTETRPDYCNRLKLSDKRCKSIGQCVKRGTSIMTCLML